MISIKQSPNNGIFGFWCTVIFFGLIFCLIFGFVLYQQTIQSHHLIDDDAEIIDVPYKEGDKA
jgi:hypothetical protein